MARRGGGRTLIARHGRAVLAAFHPTIARFAIEAATLSPSAPVLFGLGLAPQSMSFGGGCSWFVDQIVAAPFFMAEASGNARLAVPIPNDANLRGLLFHVQAAVLDPPRSVFGSVTLTQALRVTVGD